MRLGLTPGNVLDRLLDPAVRLATSTPGADPSGDYAWAVFARAESVHPGAQAVLQAKALKLVGGPTRPCRCQAVARWRVSCNSNEPVARAISGLSIVPLPASLTVGPAYGLIVLMDQPLAARFALFVLSEQGQTVLRNHGFDPIGLP